MKNDIILEMENISKAFSGVQALDKVQLKVRKGTVHALMGENGAGKSTLMKILIGVYKSDQGTIKFDGEELHITSTHYALNKGISMIFQELNPIPNMTVAENIYVGREPLTKGLFISRKKMVQDTEQLLKKLGIDSLDPNDKLLDLTVAKTQMVEIAKAVSYNSKLIIMDEPTSAITDKECDILFNIVNSLKKQGVSFIFITHKMDEVFRIADEMTVMRDGKYVGCEPASNMNQDKLIQMMVGREITHMFPKEEAEIGEAVLSVKNLTIKGLFEGISFDARKGEILGFAGLMGAGRTEIIESLFGVRKLDAGEIYINGKKVTIKTPADAIKNKMALLTEDRKLSGLFLPLSVQDNMIMASIGEYRNGLFIDYKKIAKACNIKKDQFDIKTPSLRQEIVHLSGGNQQKVLISKWLLTNPDIIILDEPTRGIDVGAKAEIHRFMSGLAKEGKTIIMISSELPEVLGMSDRIVVMCEGRMTGILDRSEADQTTVMRYATGMV
ncbi:Inositol transport system ATP-binding protein [Desulfosporosinus sp. I2]|uniref:sugar ABC transporter ATP-binding protein n=1 Tax=Desulfosporosinus sp. I2 TaxID=1617025 RepID=UPI0005F08C5A|nr:sugar ABC transporter ATP-binding protein [Desulfosporosinus sp. I2]KJR44822.1 Inositol transport system ATP-binding protein [Desulfosporosinus sp. I2]